jgi:hypothetical protein
MHLQRHDLGDLDWDMTKAEVQATISGTSSEKNHQGPTVSLAPSTRGAGKLSGSTKQQLSERSLTYEQLAGIYLTHLMWY